MVLVSVIIPTYNEEKDIAECLHSLKNQIFSNFEIIIVDDGSTDKTKEIVSNFKRIKLINGGHKGPGFSRNLGVKEAKGKILIFVDADMTSDKNYIKNLIEPIIDKKKQIIGTTHELEIVTNTENIWSRCWGKIRVSKENAKNAKAFRAIKKDEFIKLGGFDSKYGYADDQTFWFKYKIKPIVAKETICYHKNPETLKGVYKQSKWIGASLDNFFFEIPIIRYFIPLFLIIISPIAIFLLTIKKVFKIKNIKIIIPWMFIFMMFRYFGTIHGIFNKIYLKNNIK